MRQGPQPSGEASGVHPQRNSILQTDGVILPVCREYRVLADLACMNVHLGNVNSLIL